MEITKRLSTENVASNLFRIRTGMGISQQDAARMMHIPKQEFINYEEAKKPIAASDLFMLAHGLGIGVDAFFMQAN